ncbi:hypothetical protein B5M42_002560 [Paenibacillus athensensis]|nr:hypothetical protein [Paenibacillus athensensis]MCD1257721.1 hypothetical protein [Paenibacillus athensensis]
MEQMVKTSLSDRGLVQRQANAAAFMLPARSLSAAPAVRIQRTEGDFDDVSEAEEWFAGKKNEFEENPLRKARLQPFIEYFQDAVSQWKDYAAQKANVDECSAELIKYLRICIKLEEMSGQIESKITKVNTKSAPLKEVVTDFKPDSWLRSYADAGEKATMTTIHDNFNPASSSRDSFVQRLQPLLASIAEITELRDFDVKEFRKNLTSQIENIQMEVPLANFNEDYKDQAAVLKTTLDNKAKTSIQTKLEAAVADNNRLLDVEGAVDEIVTVLFEKQLKPAQVDTYIASALTLQHAPDKDIWLRKVLRLAPGHGGAYMRNIAQIDNFPAHVTRYANGIPDNPSVNTGAVTLKNDLLGNGLTAFHVTIETGAAADRRPHAYRGGITLARWDMYPQAKSGFHNGFQLEHALETTRDLEVANSEGWIDNARNSKGKGLQKNAVKNKLKN